MSSIYRSRKPWSTRWYNELTPETGTQRKYFQRLSQMRTIDKHLGSCPSSVWAKIPAQKCFFSFTAQVLSKLQHVNSVPTQQKTACVRSKDTIFLLFLSSPKSLFSRTGVFLQSAFLVWRLPVWHLLLTTAPVKLALPALSTVVSSPSQTKQHTQVGTPSDLEIKLGQKESVF